ncbi:MAG TPA: TfoX/Sxy family protein [Xanthobacteraceae bacterium]|nr:TfoX/Sxy family protein [Xanthobacteraceae bacterium]
MAYDEATAQRVRKILSGRRNVTEKKMMGGLSFMVGGAMFCSVSGRGGMLIRVGDDPQARVLNEPHVEPMTMGRRVMTSFVRVSPEGYRTDTALRKWVERALDFVAAMPKPAAARSKKSRTEKKASARKRGRRQ